MTGHLCGESAAENAGRGLILDLMRWAVDGLGATGYRQRMERLLARLERRFGRYAIHNLAYWLVGLTGVVFVLALAKPEFIRALVFDPYLIIGRHQYWRVFTFLFIPRSSSIIWFVFQMWMLWLVGSSLEGSWGALKFNLYYLLGALGTIAVAFILPGGVTNEFINTSLFLAFATMFPDYQLLIFFFPVRAKWLGLLSAGFLAYAAFSGSNAVRVAIAVAMGNYLLFFGGTLYRYVREMGTVAGRAKKRAEFAPEPAARTSSLRPARKCALCDRTDDDDGADLRVCTCQDVCGGKPTVYCLEHARSHNKRPAA